LVFELHEIENLNTSQHSGCGYDIE
jgi:hypothetical protein